MILRAVFSTTLFFSLAASALAQDRAASAPTRMCLANACLGMTALDAAKLDLQPITSYPAVLKRYGHDGFGLGPEGDAFYFPYMGSFDNKLLDAFNKAITTVCSLTQMTAQIGDSDGQLIHLFFRPTIRSGKSMLVIWQIDRRLPATISDSEMRRFETEAREQYGAAFTTSSSASQQEPAAQFVRNEPMIGNVFRLSMPYEHNASQLKAQPGCEERLSIDSD